MKALIILTIIIFSTPFSFADTIKIKDKFLNSIESLLNDNFKGTDFTIKSALKNKLHNEKSVFDASPTACDVISASIIDLSH